MRFQYLICCVPLFFSHPAWAESEPYNRVDFQSEAARTVANDLLSATLSIEVNDKSPARIAQKINAALNEALHRSDTYTSVKVTSGNQDTYPVYDKNNHLDSWRGRGELHLSSRDFKAAGELIGQLQGQMQLVGMQFSVAPETRRELENALVEEAISAFKKRADTVRNSLAGESYKIVHLSINLGSPGVMPMRAQFSVKSGLAAQDMQLAGGDSQISAQVSGTIEISP